MADAYCLLEVYTVLKSNPAHFGLPDDLQNISSRQSEKSKGKKPKEQQTEQIKQPQGKEVKAHFATSACLLFTFYSMKQAKFMINLQKKALYVFT